MSDAEARIKEYREKIEQLETDKAFYHDKWLNALEELAAAEQENARLREGIESMCRVMETLTYADISRHWAMNRLAALLAKTEGGSCQVILDD